MTTNQTNGLLDNATATTAFGCEAMQALFDTRSQYQAWLDVEAALARAQGSLGLIPAEAAERITECAKIEDFDTDEIAARSAETRHPLVPLIRALAVRCGAPAGDCVHLGSTTQDVMDTGFVLQARAGLDLVKRCVDDLSEGLRRLARDHRTTVAAGRTHGQHALPTTFGLRVAGWYEEVARHRARLDEMRGRLLVGSFGGAAGTMAGYGPKALELRRAVMEDLGLGEPGASWHANQDRFAECVSVFGMIASTAEKIAREIYFLGRTEIAEVFEGQGEAQVGSSTMPQKANPIRCQAIIAAGASLRAQVPLAMAAMVAQDDRDMGAGIALWKSIPEAFILVGGILERLVDVMSDLRVDPDRMRQNLHATGGLIVSEAVMLRLAPLIGREPAHDAVIEAARLSSASGTPFAECLADHPAIGKHLTAEELATLLDPEAYTGVAARLVEDILERGAGDVRAAGTRD